MGKKISETLVAIWGPTSQSVIIAILVATAVVALAKPAGATVITVQMGTSENEISFSATDSDGNPAEVIDVPEGPKRPDPIPGTSYVEINRDGNWSGYFNFNDVFLGHSLYYAFLEIQAAHTTNVRPHMNGNFLHRVDSGEYEYFDLMPLVLLGNNQVRMDAVPTGCPPYVAICNGGLALSAKLTLGYEKLDPPPPEEVPEPNTGDLAMGGIGVLFVLGVIKLKPIRPKR